MLTVSPAQAAGFRLRRQGLAGAARPALPEDVAGRVCGIQAQVPTAAQLGVAASILAADAGELEEPADPGGIALLPSFDSYLLAHRDKERVVDPDHYAAVYHKAGWISPVALVGGRVAGTRNHTRDRGGLAARVEFANPEDGEDTDRAVSPGPRRAGASPARGRTVRRVR